MKNAVIFDLDGTLWETIDSTFMTINKVAKKYNYNSISRELVCNNYGNSKEELAKSFFPGCPLEKSLEMIEEACELNYQNLTNNGGYIYPGLEETLFTLSEKYDLFIVSNTVSKKYIESFLISSKLFKYFKDYIAASEIILSKGDAISKLMNDYYIPNAIYVGDTLTDYEAAKSANIPFIQCLYGFDKELNCKYKVKDVSELVETAEEVFNEKNE